MSELTIFLEQIQRPSWWAEEGEGMPVKGRPVARRASFARGDVQAEVMACLKRAGKPVSRSWIEQYTGRSKSNLYFHLNALKAKGMVRRLANGGVLLWEAL